MVRNFALFLLPIIGHYWALFLLPSWVTNLNQISMNLNSIAKLGNLFHLGKIADSDTRMEDPKCKKIKKFTKQETLF